MKRYLLRACYREERALKRMPQFIKPTTSVSPTDYLRNFWCQFYGECAEEAGNRHSYLSCSLCAYRSVHLQDSYYPIDLPHPQVTDTR